MAYKKGDEFTIRITDVMTGEDGKTVFHSREEAEAVLVGEEDG